GRRRARRPCRSIQSRMPPRFVQAAGGVDIAPIIIAAKVLLTRASIIGQRGATGPSPRSGRIGQVFLMAQQSGHVPLRPIPWDADDAAKAIEEAVADALAHFKGERFWPAHPLDDVNDGNSSVYIGAAGVVWGLEYLRRQGATQARFDFRPMLPS